MKPRSPRDAAGAELPSEAEVERAALAYLSRYECSEAALSRALVAWARRRAVDAEGVLAGRVAAVVASCRERRLVDDARFAEARVRALRARGSSRRAIEARLRAAGVSAELAAGAIARHATDEAADPRRATAGAELEAARALVRRRRLGSRRTDPAERAARRAKDLAILARAGFGLEVARAALGVDGDDPWEPDDA